MFRSLALSLAVLSACAANARADFFDTSATINSPGPILNLNQILGTSSGGFTFNNAVSTPAIAPGSAINFVGVGSDVIKDYGLAGGGTAPGGAHFGAGTDIIKVFAVSGSSAIGANGATVNTITAGGIGYFAIPTGTYNQFDPRTWGTAATLIARYSLTGPQNIGQINNGIGGGIGAGGVNTISLNILNPVNAQGHFLALEVPGGLAGPGFITPNPAGLPPGSTPTGEGIHAFVNEQVVVGQTTDNTVNNAFRFVDPALSGAGGLAALDAFAALFGVAGGTFAGGAFGAGNGTGTSFNPYAGPSVLPSTLGSGDFGSLFGNTDFPGVSAETVPPGRVPEPATMLVWGVVLATGGLALRSRRKNAPAGC